MLIESLTSVGRAAIQESKYNVSICLFELVDGDEANVFSRPVEFCRPPPPAIYENFRILATLPLHSWAKQITASIQLLSLGKILFALNHNIVVVKTTYENTVFSHFLFPKLNSLRSYIFKVKSVLSVRMEIK